MSNLPPPGLINYSREVGTGVEGEERSVLVKSLTPLGAAESWGGGWGRPREAREVLCAGLNSVLHLE